MRRSRLAVTFCLLLASLSSFALAGPIGISDYSGPQFPFSASFIANAGNGTVTRFGYWLDTVGSRATSSFHGEFPTARNGYYQVVSPGDPTVLYIEDWPMGVRVIKFDGTTWREVDEIPFHAPIRNQFHSFVTVIADRSGSDIVFFRPSGVSLGVIIDTDGDRIADKIIDRNGDTFDDELKFGDFFVSAVSDTGTLYGVTNDSPSLPNNYRVVVYSVLDTDGDLIPDTPAWPDDPRGAIEFPAIPRGIGEASIDSATGRFVYQSSFMPSVLELDGDGFPIPGSNRELITFNFKPGSRVAGYTTDPQAILHDGSLASFWLHYDDYQVPEDSNHGVYILDDVNFDGIFTITDDLTSEQSPALTEKMFEPPIGAGVSPTVPALTELRSFTGGNRTISFADFGIWPDGRAFSFRQAGVERSSVTVSLEGLLSFVGPVASTPSLATLESNPGLVAPAWSDQWVTSEVRVFAGCAPTQRRFADGSGSSALSFVIEWRGLISPNGKRTSLRCLLLEDGSFRVDYGAMEIGSMPLVVGYSTDGAGALVTDDLSDNSWGGQPAGTLEEAKLGEEFGAAKPFDLAHKWVRFSGYGDVRGPRPELIAIALKKGNKIQMRANGSNIQPGATLVVDGTETFILTKSATGSKWVVTKKVTSTPGARSVESIWSDGAPHSIVVVNPDGGRSVAFNLD